MPANAPKTYRLAETPSVAETGGMSFEQRFVSQSLGCGANTIAAVRTGEFRSPKRDEWYLSGSIPEAYKAKNDLSTPFHILKLVRVQRETIVVEKVLPL